MGTFTDNLLKLTEFPFSYSFIGLLALIFGQGLNIDDEDFFSKLGPLLILMGFVATTLSITDPIGRLQKGMLYGLSVYYKARQVLFQRPTFLIEEFPEIGFDIDMDEIKSVDDERNQLEKERKIKRRYANNIRDMPIFGRKGHHNCDFCN
jgi:hypothetical protein